MGYSSVENPDEGEHKFSKKLKKMKNRIFFIFIEFYSKLVNKSIHFNIFGGASDS